MSAYVSAVFTDRADARVELIADGAICDAAYRLSGIMRKDVPIRDLPLAMTGRGDMQAVAFYANQLASFADAAGSVDGAIEQFAAFLVTEMADGRTFAAVQDFLIAGWSETKGPFHYHVVGQAGHGFEPFTLRDPGWFMPGGVFDDTDFYEAGFYVDQFENSLRFRGGRLLEAFRKKAVFDTVDPTMPRHGIGGRAHLTTIRASGISFETVGIWDDKIGEVIDPAERLQPVLSARAVPIGPRMFSSISI